MSYRTILSATWEITHFFAGIDHGVGHGSALRVRSESSNAPYSTKIIHDFVPVSVTNITTTDEIIRFDRPFKRHFSTPGLRGIARATLGRDRRDSLVPLGLAIVVVFTPRRHRGR